MKLVGNLIYWIAIAVSLLILATAGSDTRAIVSAVIVYLMGRDIRHVFRSEK